MVDVEAGVCVEDGFEDVGPEAAAWVGGCVVGLREGSEGWVGEVGVKVGCVAAFVGALVDVGGEGLVEVEEAGPFVYEGYGGDWAWLVVVLKGVVWGLTIFEYGVCIHGRIVD